MARAGHERAAFTANDDGSGGSGDLPLSPRFTVPSPPHFHVERPRLTEALDRGRRLPLTLVSAPAGSGKTTLAASWVTKGDRGRPENAGLTAWITFEEGDAHPGAFWPRVLECLRWHGVLADGDLTASSMCGHPQMLARVAAAFARLTRPLTLILDGYEITTADVSSDVDFVLRHSGQRLHLVILTRADPVLPLHRYRLADLMVELRMADLAFTEPETAQLVKRSGINLGPASISALVRRTCGWAAGLRFATMYLGQRDNPDDAVLQLAGDTGNIAEYLMAEILRTQPADVQTLLRRTSVVDVLQPGLIEELGGRSAGRTLESLARANVLVEALLEHPGWYRYHPFLRDLLRAELAYRAPRSRLRLHRRAAVWFAHHGSLDCAVGMAAAVGAWGEASAYVVDDLAIGAILVGNAPANVVHALRQMPPEVNDRAAVAVRAALALVDSDTERCAEELRRSRPSSSDPGSAHESAVQLAIDLVDAARGCRVDDPQTLTFAESAERNLAAQAREKLAAHPELMTLVQASKGIAQLRKGEITEARRTLSAAASAAEAPGCEALRASCLGYLALIASLHGELRRARDWASRAIAVAERTDRAEKGYPPAAEVALAWVSVEQYDLRTGGEHVKAALRSSILCDDPVSQTMSALVQARLHRARGELDAAIALIDGAGVCLPDNASWLAVRLEIEAATLRVVRGEPEVAVGIVEGLGEVDGAMRSLVAGQAHLVCEDWAAVEVSVSDILARGTGAPLQTTVGGRLLEVVHALHCGQAGRARIALARALRLAAPEILRRPFWEAPGVVRQMLESDTVLVDQNRWLGSPIGSPRRTLPPQNVLIGSMTAASADDRIIEPLTAKEVEVLGHLSELLSTEEIATAMFVSVNTVRTHVRSILRKLAVSRRNEAVRRARALSLIAS